MNVTMRVGVLAAAISPFLVSGCVSTSFHPDKTFEARELRPVSPEAVRVFRSEPNGTFLTLGEIVADISGFWSDEAVIRKVREKAAAVGADAIILDGVGWSLNPMGDDVVTYSQMSSVRFTAVRFLPEISSHGHL
jgi:hypothetical protein